MLQGLAPGTIFHYRLIAAHSDSPTAYGPDETFMTYPSPRPVPRIRATTRPRSVRRRPYTLTSSGRITDPRSIPSNYACNGNVEVEYFDGSRRVGASFLAVQSNCAFSGPTTVGRIPGHGKHSPPVALRVLIRFLGNHYLAPNRANRGASRSGDGR